MFSAGSPWPMEKNLGREVSGRPPKGQRSRVPDSIRSNRKGDVTEKRKSPFKKGSVPILLRGGSVE